MKTIGVGERFLAGKMSGANFKIPRSGSRARTFLSRWPERRHMKLGIFRMLFYGQFLLSNRPSTIKSLKYPWLIAPGQVAKDVVTDE